MIKRYKLLLYFAIVILFVLSSCQLIQPASLPMPSYLVKNPYADEIVENKKLGFQPGDVVTISGVDLPDGIFIIGDGNRDFLEIYSLATILPENSTLIYSLQDESSGT